MRCGRANAGIAKAMVVAIAFVSGALRFQLGKPSMARRAIVGKAHPSAS
jgi:hypothetical protein